MLTLVFGYSFMGVVFIGLIVGMQIMLKEIT